MSQRLSAIGAAAEAAAGSTAAAGLAVAGSAAAGYIAELTVSVIPASAFFSYRAGRRQPRRTGLVMLTVFFGEELIVIVIQTLELGPEGSDKVAHRAIAEGLDTEEVDHADNKLDFVDFAVAVALLVERFELLLGGVDAHDRKELLVRMALLQQAVDQRDESCKPRDGDDDVKACEAACCVSGDFYVAIPHCAQHINM